ncbi:hypothetical protein CEUSTIGMA_g8471.t1 [Chlamydomonas eustigma]|uniref:Uncharacterized protein n=1 Tax=Chlamydomonas eustigma TaxID=1157962 RepID=A0A250XDA3_9CHLO|nr:hypothetical protein CEUSTIGMA_g8471.t1 [Chlamydomonas eustigma]|eukprot:GAX81036.1 hypothetical protein CEUSTIGMA_g8471.t1 [Chlamydomonas eustigma]
MKSRTQLAELIMGAGLVGGAAKRKNDDKDEHLRQEQPVLYGYGPQNDSQNSGQLCRSGEASSAHHPPPRGPSGRYTLQAPAAGTTTRPSSSTAANRSRRPSSARSSGSGSSQPDSTPCYLPPHTSHRSVSLSQHASEVLQDQYQSDLEIEDLTLNTGTSSVHAVGIPRISYSAAADHPSKSDTNSHSLVPRTMVASPKQQQQVNQQDPSWAIRHSAFLPHSQSIAASAATAVLPWAGASSDMPHPHSPLMRSATSACHQRLSADPAATATDRELGGRQQVFAGASITPLNYSPSTPTTARRQADRANTSCSGVLSGPPAAAGQHGDRDNADDDEQYSYHSTPPSAHQHPLAVAAAAAAQGAALILSGGKSSLSTHNTTTHGPSLASSAIKELQYYGKANNQGLLTTASSAPSTDDVVMLRDNAAPPQLVHGGPPQLVHGGPYTTVEDDFERMYVAYQDDALLPPATSLSTVIPLVRDDDTSAADGEEAPHQHRIQMLQRLVEELKVQLSAEQVNHDRSLKAAIEETVRRAQGDYDTQMQQIQAEYGEKVMAAEREVAELKAQLQMVISERANAATEAGMKGLRATKMAEEKAENAETQRRIAERRASVAESECIGLRDRLDVQGRELETVMRELEAERSASEGLKKAAQEAAQQVREEHRAMTKKSMADVEAAKKSLQETVDKLTVDLAKRTQTLLAVQSELEEVRRTVLEQPQQQLLISSSVSLLPNAGQDSLPAKDYVSSKSVQHSYLPQASDHAAVMDHVFKPSERPSSLSTLDTMPYVVEGMASGPAAKVEPQTVIHGNYTSSTSGASLAASNHPAGHLLRGSENGISSSISSAILSTSSAAHALLSQTSTQISSRPGTANQAVMSRSETSRKETKQHNEVTGSSSGSGSAGKGGGSNSSSNNNNLGEALMKATRRHKTELAACREDYARRLLDLEASLRKGEAASRELTRGVEALFTQLTHRTASLLAGRVATFGGLSPAFHPLPVGTCSTSATPSQLGNTSSSATASVATVTTWLQQAAASNATAPSSSALHRSLSSGRENACLLAELAKFHAGKHPLQRKLQQAATGTAGNSAGTTGNTTSSQLPPTSVAFSTTTASQQGSAASSSSAAVKEALASAVREVLLCSRQELLPALMTAEGWEGSGCSDGAGGNTEGGSGSYWSSSTCHMGGKAEAAVSAAESSMRMRAEFLELQREVVLLRTELLASQSATAASTQRCGSQETTLKQTKKELSAAEKRILELQEEFRHYRNGGGYAGGGASSVYGDGDAVSSAMVPGTLSAEKLEEKLRLAKEEVVRYKNLLAAVKKEKDLKERQVEELQARLDRGDMQIRELRTEAGRQEEGVRRLRSLLQQARSLLREAGVPFMEDVHESGLGNDTSASGSSKTKVSGSGGLSSKGGSVSGDDGAPLFKALDAREREKEISRLQREVAEAQHAAGLAHKEVKRHKGLAERAAAELNKERDEAASRLAASTHQLAKDVADARQAAQKSEAALRAVDSEVMELRRQLIETRGQLERTKLDADYLKARASKPRPKPKLCFARAFTVTVCAEDALE